ncbi:MAG: DUF2975 domain-containing protein [Endozoicomonas sp.]|uniref:DUF2975 domain-containing protein n=1 Tax=Endozoicomonas sp. TaxID=1892382 RepID=UPI003D9B6007
MTTNKIKVISKAIRWLILSLSAVAVAYLLWSFFYQGTYNFNSDSTQFQQLWYESEANKGALFLYTAPGLILWAVLVYWACRLLSSFEQGNYFSQESIRCYLWLVWVQVAMFVGHILFTLGISFYHRQLFEDSVTMLSLDLTEIFILFFMVVVLHVLKAARQIEQENKEFI